MLAEQAATIDDLQAQLRRSAMPGSAAGASLALSPEKLQVRAQRFGLYPRRLGYLGCGRLSLGIPVH